MDSKVCSPAHLRVLSSDPWGTAYHSAFCNTSGMSMRLAGDNSAAQAFQCRRRSYSWEGTADCGSKMPGSNCKPWLAMLDSWRFHSISRWQPRGPWGATGRLQFWVLQQQQAGLAPLLGFIRLSIYATGGCHAVGKMYHCGVESCEVLVALNAPMGFAALRTFSIARSLP